MDNAIEALKMGVSILIFVGALSLAIVMLSRVRQTSAIVMENGDRNKTFYDNIKYSKQREVGTETIITNCYLYFKNDTTILFYTGSIDQDGNVTIGQPITLYNTESLETDMKQSHLLTNGRGVFGLDINDERSRKEPWTKTEQSNKNFITALVRGLQTERYAWSRSSVAGNSANGHELRMNFTYMNSFGGQPFVRLSKNARFIERVGIYKYYTSDMGAESIYITGSDTTKKQFIDENGNSIAYTENTNAGDFKKVIQYVYVGRK